MREGQATGRIRARLMDVETIVHNVKEDVDKMKLDLLWCVITLAKMTNTDPPSSEA